LFQPQTIVDQAHQPIHTQFLDVGGHRLANQQSFHPPTYAACYSYPTDTVSIPIDQAASTAHFEAVVVESKQYADRVTSADGGTPRKDSKDSTAASDDREAAVEASNPEDDVQWTSRRTEVEEAAGVEDDGQQNSDRSEQSQAEMKRGCCSTASCSDSGVGVNNAAASMTVLQPMGIHVNQNGRPESLKRCSVKLRSHSMRRAASERLTARSAAPRPKSTTCILY